MEDKIQELKGEIEEHQRRETEANKGKAENEEEAKEEKKEGEMKPVVDTSENEA